MAVRTRWSPDAVIDAPPKVLDQVIELLDQQDKQRAREELQSRLRRRGR